MESIKRPRLLPHIAPLALCAALAGLPTLAQAQIFMCKDANGRTITSDKPIPECANRAVKELNRNGSVKREIPAPLTPEEQRAKREADEKRKVDEAAAAEQRRRDIALLSTYQNEDQIEAERKRTITQIRNNINIAVTEQNSALQRRKVAQTEIDAIKDKTKPVPPNLKARLDEADRAVLYETKTKESLEAELVKAKNKYDDLLTRYRQVSSNGPGKSNSESSSAPAPKP